MACSITDDDEDPYWPKFLQLITCYCSYTWAVQLIRWVFHFDISVISWFKGQQGPLLCFLESSQLKLMEETRAKRYHNIWCTDSPRGLVNMAPRPFFLVKSKTSGLVTTLKCWLIRISELQDIGLMEFCCNTHSKGTFKLSGKSWKLSHIVKC